MTSSGGNKVAPSSATVFNGELHAIHGTTQVLHLPQMLIELILHAIRSLIALGVVYVYLQMVLGMFLTLLL